MTENLNKVIKKTGLTRTSLCYDLGQSWLVLSQTKISLQLQQKIIVLKVRKSAEKNLKAVEVHNFALEHKSYLVP